MARYVKLYSSIWTSGRFIGLSDADRVVFLYLCSCEHQSSVGVARVPAKYAAADLERAEGDFISALERIESAGLIKADRHTNEVFVRNWFDFNGPTNQKHAAGILKIFDEVKSQSIRAVATAEFSAKSFNFEKSEVRGSKRQTRDRPGKIYGDEKEDIPF